MKVVFTTSMDNLRAFDRFGKRSRFPEMRKRYRSQRKTTLLIAVLLTFISPALTIAGGLHLVLHDWIIGFIPLLFGAFFMLIVGWQLLPHVRRRRNEKKWLQYPHLGRPVTVEVDERGFQYLEETIERRMDWGAITEVEESPTHLFVVDCQPLCYIIPKEAFSSPAQAAAFRDQITASLKAAQTVGATSRN